MDIDPAIAAAMGFASFGTKPGEKRKYNPDDGYVDPSISSQGQTTKATSSSAEKGVKLPAKPPPTSEDNVGPSTAPVRKLPADATLEELKNGVRNEQGDMVYFMPSFIEDPWKDLKPK